MPNVPPPETLPSEAAMVAEFSGVLPDAIKRWFAMDRPIETRPVDPSSFVRHGRGSPVQNVWLRAAGPLPDDPAIHRAVLAYLSDMTLLDTALIAHGYYVFDTKLQVASLDHALWFHRPFRADEWLLYVQDSPNSSGARGLTRGLLFSRDGRLIASVMQEGLMRPNPASSA
jgi:acyl-CoA thioesterase-2